VDSWWTPMEYIWTPGGVHQDRWLSVQCSVLDSHSWIHFACYKSQGSILGMKSGFALHNGQLELGTIAAKRLFNAQFAFLSACHAASGLKELPGEAIHLAAGLQFSGFLSVIATMWSDDALKVAEYTYQYLFHNGLEGLNPFEAATALNHAICNIAPSRRS
jgi:CHAT domain-containing protein